MLELSKEGKIEFNLNELDDYIENFQNTNKNLTPTQIDFIANIIVQNLETMFEAYKYYPGEILKNLQMLAEIEKIGEKNPKSEAWWSNIVEQKRNSPLGAFNSITNSLGVCYRIGINNLRDFKLYTMGNKKDFF
jgi:hypothetical protein